MILQSVLIGILFGLIWASMFVKQFRAQKSRHMRPSSIATTSILRSLILLIALIILITKKYIVIMWWFVGFIIAFWGILLPFFIGGKHEN